MSTFDSGFTPDMFGPTSAIAPGSTPPGFNAAAPAAQLFNAPSFLDAGGGFDQYLNTLNPTLAKLNVHPLLKALMTTKMGFSSGGTSFGINMGGGNQNAQIMAMVKDFLGRNQLGGRSQANNPVTITPASEARAAAPIATPGPFGLNPATDLAPIRSRVPGAGGGGLGPFGL